MVTTLVSGVEREASEDYFYTCLLYLAWSLETW